MTACVIGSGSVTVSLRIYLCTAMTHTPNYEARHGERTGGWGDGGGCFAGVTRRFFANEIQRKTTRHHTRPGAIDKLIG